MTGSIAIQRFLWAGAGALLLVPLFSCRLTPKSHRMTADSGAFAQIEDAQRRAVGRVEPIGVETPADTLRRRLLLDQLLPHGGIVSLGVRDLPDNEYWNKERDLLPPLASSPLPGMKGQWTVSLVQALQVAAAGSRDFQRAKDDLFRAALDLDLEANAFRTTFTGMFKQLLDSSHGGGGRDTASRTSVEAGAKRVFKNGVQLTSAIALDLVELLTQEKGVSTGVRMDASISIPLLRGSGRRVVMEPLTQAQRNLLYRVYEFERYKRTFAVAVASDYFAVLLQKRKVGNQEENYKRVIASTRRARRLADSGRLPEFQFDQSVQDELSARNSWIRARQAYASKLDGFKLLIGVSPDANLVLAEGDLAILQKRALQLTEGARMADYSGEIPPADAPVKLREPSREKLGTYELDSRRAIETALGKRMDLRVREARVEDAQRGVYMAVDGLRAEITLLGKAGMGGRRSVGQSGSENAKLNIKETAMSGLLTIDLPIERTAERNAYRAAILALEESVRVFQKEEDQVKLDVRRRLRDLEEARESVLIQTQAVTLAESRVRSTDLFLQAGRAAIRDVLDAQESLLSAQNSLSSALVGYRVAELEIQRDMGVLEVSVGGAWQEYDPAKEMGQ